jgi:hypothetical protein
MTETLDDARYPIGRFTPSPGDAAALRRAIEDIRALPRRMREAVAALSDAQLDTPYRDGGWSVRQVVHHVADSHMNGLVRLKLALTEESPTIKPYDENRFALLPDMRLPIAVSLDLLDGVHARWAAVYDGMGEGQFARTFYHPEQQRSFTLDGHAQNYGWHSRHHVAHITELRRRQGW